ncbi:MAG: hypothetical protein ACKV2T_02810 [Kofleriaceae bacterium]
MNKAIVTGLLFAALVGDAHAERQFVDGQFLQNRAECERIRNPAANTWASYENELSTGDVAYVRAVVWNGNKCKKDRSAFWFVLPEGAVLAVSPQTPVRCLRGNGTGYVEEVPYSATSNCLQKPLGTATNFYFGHSDLEYGWFLEIQVPVRYRKRLDGSQWQHDLMVTTVSDFGHLYPTVRTRVTYRPAFTSHRLSSVDAFSASIAFSLEHFFETGIVDVAYGTDPDNLWQGTPTITSDSSQLSTSASRTLASLDAATTYFWRVRITTATGTYVGPLQTFATATASFAPMPCRRFRC